MSKLKKIVEPQGPAPNDHPELEVLAAFTEAQLDPHHRQEVVAHLSSCKECYELVQQSLADLEKERQEVRQRLQGGGGRKVFGLAASFIFCLLLASGVWLSGVFMPQQAQVVQMEIDEELRSMLLEDEALVWRGEKAERLVAMLGQRGIKGLTAATVRLDSLYDPYLSKSLSQKKEIVIIKVEEGVIYLQLKSRQDENNRE